MRLTENPLYRKCREEEETSTHAFCECEALTTLSQHYLGSFFLDSKDVTNLSLGAIWNLIKGTGFP
jgi:hypothetical protein